MIKKRIIQLLEYKGIAKEEFYKKIGVTSANFRGKASETPVNSKTIENILSEISDLNLNWLLTGKGSMLEKSENIPINDGDYNIVNEQSKNYITNGIIEESIPLIPIEAMAGYGAGETQIMEFEAERFVVPTFKGADFLIQVKGSSMYPKYNSGDIVACKKLSRDDVFFQWNKVYVLDTEQGALIKRIDIATDDDHVMIVSDNEKYKPFQLHKSKINAISIVMGVIRLE